MPLIGETVDTWRAMWARERNKHDLGPTDHAAWLEYLDSLSVSDVLFNLMVWESLDENGNPL